MRFVMLLLLLCCCYCAVAVCIDMLLCIAAAGLEASLDRAETTAEGALAPREQRTEVEEALRKYLFLSPSLSLLFLLFLSSHESRY